MADGLNRVMLLGNLGADPDLRYGQNQDTAVLRLRLATSESYFDKRTNERKERTDWHNVVVFGKRGEALQKILTKGSTIFVEGRLQTSSYEKEGQRIYKTDVVASNIILAGGRSAGGGSSGGERGERAPSNTRSSDYRGSSGSARQDGAPPRRQSNEQHDAHYDDGPGGGEPPPHDDDIPF